MFRLWFEGYRFVIRHKHQWVFETKDDGDGIGYINLQKPSYKVSSDELFFAADPTLAVYPLGTYVAGNQGA